MIYNYNFFCVYVGHTRYLGDVGAVPQAIPVLQFCFCCCKNTFTFSPSPISPAFRQKSPRNAFVLRIFFVTGAHPGFSNIWTWQLSGPEAPKSTLWRGNITEKTNKAHEYCKTLQFWFRKTWSLKSIYNQSICASLFEKSQIPLLGSRQVLEPFQST